MRARYAILVDPASGAVLWGRRSRTPAPPASLTKMLTALAVRASLDLDDVTVASKAAASQPARRLAMRRGQKLTVDQALKALMMVSANDVAVMLAEAAGGSVARFSRPWTPSRSGSACGSSWRNPTAWTPAGRATAFDLAILARAVLQDRWLARVVRKRHAAFVTPSGRRHSLTARSRFLLGYRGAVGVKTGFTDDAGHCLAAAATRGGRTLIAVVLHSPDNAGDAGRMLDWGFGRGRSARTGLRLPAPVAPASVAALLTRPPASVERHHPADAEALASAGLAGVRRAGGFPGDLVLAGPPAGGHGRRRRRRPPGRRRARHPQTPPADLTPGPGDRTYVRAVGLGTHRGRSRRMLMRTTIGPDDAATVGELLREIGQGRTTPEELRDAAIYWSVAIDPDMECADLQTIAWLLRDASAHRRIPTAERDRARYWAAYLEGRMAS